MTIKSTVAVLSLLCAAVSSIAQPMPGPQGGDGIPERITRADAIKQAGAGFDLIDANHDGIVTRDEIMVYRKKMQDAMQAAPQGAGPSTTPPAHVKK